MEDAYNFSTPKDLFLFFINHFFLLQRHPRQPNTALSLLTTFASLQQLLTRTNIRYFTITNTHPPSSVTMAGQVYFQDFQQFAPIDPQLDPFNDSLSELVDYDRYHSNEPNHPGLTSNNYEPLSYHHIPQSIESYQYAISDAPVTPTPPPRTYAGIAPTPPTSSDDYTDSASSVSPPPAKRRATRSKKDSITPKKDRSHVERRELPAVASSGLRFTNAHDAELFGLRVKVNLPDDDWEAIAADPEPWVKKMMAAFDAEPIKEPTRYNKEGKIIPPAKWAKFQADHVEKTKNHIAKNPAMVEVGAWQLFQAIIDAHKSGYLNFKADSTKICSVQMQEAVQAIADYAVIRFDVIRCQGIDNLASSVTASIMRKLNCCNGNSAKKEREERNAQKCAEKGVEYENVLGSGQKSTGGNNKRKRKDSE